MKLQIPGGIVLLAMSLNATLADSSELLSCDGFESCSTVDTETVAALEARIVELERLLAGAQRDEDVTTGADTLTLPNTVASNALRIDGLLNSDVVGRSPLCSDLDGNVLPCPDDYIPPPNESVIGRWTGIKRTDPDYNGLDICFDDEISFDLALSSGGIVRLVAITTRRDGVGIDITSPRFVVESGFVSSSYSAFDTGFSFSMQFDELGTAFGEWAGILNRDYPEDECFGTFVLTRE